ncbi:MAG: AAA domain-containing protein [Rothia sp. (in: high G+C Gram-positive bacteria)]|nr:AAA domain-containing protein [Rothia sp. (in: high G+C Gram-positive bacteria)]
MFFISSQTSSPHLPNLEPQGQDLIVSASDLVTAAQCQFAALHTLDQALGRIPRLKISPDHQLQRAAALGQAHEEEILKSYLATYGPWDPETGKGVYLAPAPSSYSREALEESRQQTLAAIAAGAQVIYQASFFDGSFHGRADFLVREAAGSYRVVDSKLARTARIPALLQLAAYADQLQKEGIPLDPQVALILGNKTESLHPLDTLMPVFQEKRQSIYRLLREHRRSGQAPISWYDSPQISRCGRCEICRSLIISQQDMLLTAGMTARTRQSIYQHCQVQSLQDLAALAGNPKLPGIVRRYAEQAALQTGRYTPDGSVTYSKNGQEETVSYKLLGRTPLPSLPRASAGDLFISLHQDPLWQDPYGPPTDKSWGLTYALGAVHLQEPTDTQPLISLSWASSRAEEARLLTDLLSLIHQKGQEHPGRSIYYFGAQTLKSLQQLSTLHNQGEALLTDLQREGKLIDLSEILRRSMRISCGTKDLSSLEPLYAQDLEPALPIPVSAHSDLSQAQAQGRAEEAQAIKDALAHSLYRTGLSLSLLRAWLLSLTGRSQTQEIQEPAPQAALSELIAQAGRAEEETPVEKTLNDFLAALGPNSGLDREKEAIAMVASATSYHRRERRQFWWDHFNRLTAPKEDWEDSRDILLLGRLEVSTPWHRPERARSLQRVLEGTARLAPGSSLKEGDQGLFAMYTRPLPAFLQEQAQEQALAYASLHQGVLPLEAERAGAFSIRILALEEIPEEQAGQPHLVRLRLQESLPSSQEQGHQQLPMAITPSQPIPTQAQEQALLDLAARTARTLPQLPLSAGTDLLYRTPPRLLGGGPLPRVEDYQENYGSLANVQAIYQAVGQLDRSYLAVQGPPGSGKTFLGSQVIGRLLAQGWKIGIVAQSHAVIENMLLGCIHKGGVDPDQVAKGLGKSQSPDFPWREVGNADISRFMDEPGGRLFGGTAWDFASDRKFREEGLDLLVIDEAGQYSLANTLAVARSAKNLLLLGDPAQLPQVTQGSHPYPVDESALGWLSGGSRILPQEFGYFLDLTWRMHPALCAPVSTLSYQGQLTSAPSGQARELEGWEPGVYRYSLEHQGRSTASVEEAAAVVSLARRFIGSRWIPNLENPAQAGPLEAQDIIVVAAYNAQVDCIRQALQEAGLADADGGGVRVGTVDKFQGQEAPLVFVSMAASNAGESPRGTEFLLSPNRLNVALSRGMWAAVLIYSQHFTDFLPSSPEALKLLGSFLRLEAAARPLAPAAGGPGPQGSEQEGVS